MRNSLHETSSEHLIPLFGCSFIISVAGVLHGHNGQDEVSHAMVLDTFDADNDKLIFKNTYDQEGQPKKVEISRTDPNAPELLLFVHIESKDIDNLPGQDERKALREPEMETRKRRFTA